VCEINKKNNEITYYIKLIGKNIVCVLSSVFYSMLITNCEYIRYLYLKMLMILLKIEISLKTDKRTQIMFLPISLIIGHFTLILSYKMYSAE